MEGLGVFCGTGGFDGQNIRLELRLKAAREKWADRSKDEAEDKTRVSYGLIARHIVALCQGTYGQEQEGEGATVKQPRVAFNFSVPGREGLSGN